MSWVLLGAVAGASPACGYQPGSFSSPQRTFTGERVTEGCLDLAVQRRADQRSGPASGPVLAFQFGNRCDHPTLVDLAAVSIVGRGAGRGELALRPYDPRAELRAVMLDGRSVGAEAIAYPAPRAVREVCVDTASLVGERPARWLCLGEPARTVVGSVP